MFELLNYSFIVRGLTAGMIIGIIAPMIGMFLVLRRYSLIADTLSHVSLAGVALGLLLNINPLITAIGASVVASVVIEKLRLSRKIYGESALAVFLSGSLALAVVLIGLAHGFNVDIFNYLFGSIVTVTNTDMWVIAGVGVLVMMAIGLLYKELVYTTFDEEAAQVSGLPTGLINQILIILASLTVALAIPIVGILLIAALMVIPVLAALQFRLNFGWTMLAAVLISVFSVVSGVLLAFLLNLSTGGVIVLIALGIFLVSLLLKR